MAVGPRDLARARWIGSEARYVVHLQAKQVADAVREEHAGDTLVYRGRAVAADDAEIRQ